MLHFAIRNRKEIFRDPLSIILGIALPLILLIVFTTIEKNAPLDTFKAHNLVPGLVVFSFSFLTMFSALLIAKDKQTALLVRLFASPLKVNDYVVGYTIPMIPLVILQTIICYLVALALGMSVELIDFLMSMVVLLPITDSDHVHFLWLIFRRAIYRQTNFRDWHNLYYARIIFKWSVGRFISFR
ncbi:ABC transporter permease [Bacillus aquiflavi]|uniref:ABC transporter permease n=1 Tax=Bacillus aquiflavi TaxID=2672567 RepID=UPI00223BD19E|nr:ABC transporter permease [Bacillus aquiflavi]